MYYGMNGLGEDQTKSTIRWWCWDVKGFKDCHARQYAQAQRACEQDSSAYSSIEACVTKETDTRTKLNCDCPSSPPAEKDEEGIGSTGTYLLGFGILALVGVLVYRDQQKRKATV